MELLESMAVELELSVRTGWRNGTIMASIARFGYDDMRMQQGIDLCRNARTLCAALADANAAKENAELEEDQRLEKARDIVNEDVAILLTVFEKNAEAINTLRLKEKRIFAYESWHAQTTGLYRRLLAHPHLLETSAAWGLNTQNCQEHLQQVEEVHDLGLSVRETSDRIRELRRQCKEQLAELKSWRKTFHKFLRLGLAKRPDLLASVGIKSEARTSRVKATKPILTPPVTQPLLPPVQPPTDEPSEPSLTVRPEEGEEEPVTA